MQRAIGKRRGAGARANGTYIEFVAAGREEKHVGQEEHSSERRGERIVC